MKKLLLIPVILLVTCISAQEIESSAFFDPFNKSDFKNTLLSKNTNEIKTTLDIYNLGYKYEVPKITHQLFPNPANSGDYVTINPVKLGELIHIYEPTGNFVQSQVIDIDKRIYTIDLKKGEYLIKTTTGILNLLVK